MVDLSTLKGIVECPNPVDLMDVKNNSLITSQLPLFYSYFNAGEFKQYLKSGLAGRNMNSFRFFQDLWLSPKDVVSVWRSHTPNRDGCSFQIIYPERKFSLERAKTLSVFLKYFAFPPEAPGWVNTIESDNAPIPYHFRTTISIIQS